MTRSLLAVATVALTLGCKSSPSKTALFVAVDIDPALSLDEVVMSVTVTGKATLVQTFAASNQVTWTVIFPTTGSPLTVTVLVSGSKGGKPIVSTRAAARVASGQTTDVRLKLSALCANISCDSNHTCFDGECAPIPMLQPGDGGVDAASDTDGPTRDADPRDADLMDTSQPIDTSPDRETSADPPDVVFDGPGDGDGAPDRDSSPPPDARVDGDSGGCGPANECAGGTRQQACGKCNRGTRTDTCMADCRWFTGICSDPDMDLDAITNAFQQTIAETSEANWGFGGACSANNVRDSYQVTKQAGDGSCAALYSEWAKLNDTATPVRGDNSNPMPISDTRFCGVVIGVVGPATCHVVVKQRRVCP